MVNTGNWFNDMMFTMLMVIGFYWWLARKVLVSNPAIGNAAKQAANVKVVQWISRWGK